MDPGTTALEDMSNGSTVAFQLADLGVGGVEEELDLTEETAEDVEDVEDVEGTSIFVELLSSMGL